MYNQVAYTPPAPTWPPKQQPQGMGAVTCLPCPPGYVSTGAGFCVGVTPATRFGSHPQDCIQTGGKITAGLAAYERQYFVTPQRLLAALQSAQIQIPQGWGMGLYEHQNFVTPQRLKAPLVSSALQIPAGWGMSGDCGCGCGGKCKGMGQLFETTDISQWGIGEWAVIGLGGLGLIFAVNAISKGVGGVRSYTRKRASRARKKAALQSELAGL